MFKDNPLLAQLKQQIRETIPKVEGTVKATDKNYGFLQTDNKKSFFIAPPFMKKLLAGDRISAIVRENGDKKSAEPETLIETSLVDFIARVDFANGKTVLRADHPLIKTLIPVKANKQATTKLEKGDWVAAKLIKHAFNDNQFQAQVSSHIAAFDDPFARWKATAAKHKLAWDEADVEAPSTLADEARRDLTDQLFFTIDGEQTKDMDDALAIEKTAQGWCLSVAIADPSAYFDENHPLEAIAKERAFTLYLPAKTVPMMPAEFANQTCALQANQQRSALVCQMNISDSGELLDDAEFFSATICSKHRLSYNSVSQQLSDDADVADASLHQHLQQLAACATARYQWRAENTNVFGEQTDYSFDLSDQGEVIAIHSDSRNIAHQMVEESMVAANIAAGRFLHQQLGYGIFSVHSGYKVESNPQIQAILDHYGYQYKAEELQDLATFCELRRHIAHREDHVTDSLLKRFYNFSIYSDKAAAHFGLGEAYYATWTSPIRKYCDLLNHRLIKAVIQQKTIENPLTEALNQHLSDARRKQKQAERDMSRYLYCQYYAQLPSNQVLEASIIGVSKGGLMVKLTESGAVGFLAKKYLAKKADEIEFSIEFGFMKTPAKEYLLGDQLQVCVDQVNLEQQNISFSLPN